MQEKNEAASSLYYAIDRGVDRWIQDMRYVPRLLLVACVFLVTYFVFSLAVRDPIPIIDELLIAGVVSVLLWTVLARKDKQSAVAMKKRLELKRVAGDASIEILSQLDVLEAYLSDMVSRDPMEVCDLLAGCSEEPLPSLVVQPEARGPWMDEVFALLVSWVKVNDKATYRRLRQLQVARKSGKPDEVLAARMLHQSLSGQLDLPILALCVAFGELV
jgi:hypothetical protein